MKSSFKVVKKDIALTNAISLEATDVIELTVGSVTLVERSGLRRKVSAPATVVADYRYCKETEADEVVYVGVIRQVVEGTSNATQAHVYRPSTDGIRKVLRDLAVEGEHKVNNKLTLTAQVLPNDWSNVDDKVATYTLKTPGGFIPLTPEGWVPVDVSNPSLYPHRTSWCILRETDNRIIYDAEFDD